MEIGLATAAHYPDLDPDSQYLLRALCSRGIDAQPVIWTDPEVDYTQMALCMIRSTWDYATQRDQYLEWANRIAKETVLLNPPDILAWNTDKRYLKDFEKREVPIVPTLWFESDEITMPEAIQSQLSCETIIIKPAISASGNNVYQVNLNNLPEFKTLLQQLAPLKPLMIQPFLSSIQNQGETSFIFINGEFAHAVRKYPAKSDFRVQEHLGGQTQAYVPTDPECQAARQVIEALDQPLLYARVDMVYDHEGQLLLSELEATEPSLYLIHHPETADIVSEALIQRLKNLEPALA